MEIVGGKLMAFYVDQTNTYKALEVNIFQKMLFLLVSSGHLESLGNSYSKH